MRELYPPIEPFDDAFLKVSDIHTVHYEQVGNPKGKKALFLHGGPGGGIDPDYRRYFDPAKWHIVLYDQRGSGKSTPYAELRENTTWDLVADIERMREHLGIDSGWSSAAAGAARSALAYAQAHPERVSGARAARDLPPAAEASCSWFYQEGASRLFPDAWDEYLAPIPRCERGDLMSAYYRRLTRQDRRRPQRGGAGVVDLGGHDQQAARRPRYIEALRRRRVRRRLRAHRGALLRARGCFETRRPAAARTPRRSAHLRASSCRAATTWCARRRGLGPSQAPGRSRSW